MYHIIIIIFCVEENMDLQMQFLLAIAFLKNGRERPKNQPTATINPKKELRIENSKKYE